MAGNIHKGTIAFNGDAMSLSYKPIAGSFTNVTIPYGDIEYYTRSLGDIFLVHHKTQYPKVIMVTGSWEFLRSSRIKKVEQALQSHGVKFSEEVSANARKGATKALVVSTVIAVAIVAVFLAVAAIVKK